MNIDSWLLLVYKIPPTPTSARVYVWRKLKQLGVLLLHDSVWVLPSSDRTRERLRWLAMEIIELKGEATLWESRLDSAQQHADLVRQFSVQLDAEYRGLLEELKNPANDVNAIARRYQQTKVREYFTSSVGEQVRAGLLRRREVTEESAL